MYRCAKCEEEYDSLPSGIIRCPSCAHKVFFKVRQPVLKKVGVE